MQTTVAFFEDTRPTTERSKVHFGRSKLTMIVQERFAAFVMVVFDAEPRIWLQWPLKY
jgi:hypothetical protein